MTNRWLLLNFDILGGFAVLITTLFALTGYAKAGTAGLCITSAMTFTTSVYWACRYWTTLELDLKYVFNGCPTTDALTHFTALSNVLWNTSISHRNLLP